MVQQHGPGQFGARPKQRGHAADEWWVCRNKKCCAANYPTNGHCQRCGQRHERGSAEATQAQAAGRPATGERAKQAAVPVGATSPPQASAVVITVIDGFVSAEGGTAKMRKREISKRLQEHPEWKRPQRASQPAATQATAAAGGQPAGQHPAPATADDGMGGQPTSQSEPAPNVGDTQIEALEATLKFFTTEAAQLQSTFGLDLYKLKLDAAQADLREARERRKQSKPLHLRVKNADHHFKMYAGRQQRAVAALEQLEKHHADLVAAHVKAIAALDKQR